MDGWRVPAAPDPASRADTDTVCFQDLQLHDRVLRAVLDDLQFSVCTPIQAKALGPALAGRDVAGEAQTGTGKTAAFLITILEKFLKEQAEAPSREPNQPLALVLAPTRELAVQIDRDAVVLARHSGLRHVAVYGGLANSKEHETLFAKGVDLVSATPGRLLDYLRRRLLDLSKVAILVIDEADRMLDMGFIPDVRRICARLPDPGQRQTLLFSATLPPEILQLADRWMQDQLLLAVNPDNVVAEGVNELVYAVRTNEKLALLLWLLRQESCDRALIFRNRRRDTEALHRQLERYGINCALMSGDVPQKRRMRILDCFRNGELPVIVATDVAGRGIHVESISHVVNYDLPYEPQDYVHRVGRTGRAGKQGLAVSFACEEESFVIPEIEKLIGRELPVSQPEEQMLVLPPVDESVRIRHRPVGSSRSGSGRSDHRDRRRPSRGGGGRGGSAGRRPSS